MSAKTILIVDGDTVSLNFLERMLQEQQYSVLGAGLGKEGLINTWRDRPDLIIFDPVLQDISSEEFLQGIRQDSRSANIPLLALSSDPNPEKESACLQAGCNHYVVKSAEAVTTLPAVISSLLEIKHEEAAQKVVAVAKEG